MVKKLMESIREQKKNSILAMVTIAVRSSSRSSSRF